MQMLGIGLPELLVILLLAAIVVGPERLPQFATDLAQWIRRMRLYSQHLMRDFNDVMGDLEKEVGTSREDWKEIASLVTRSTGDITREFTSLSSQLGRLGDLSTPPSVPAPSPQPPNVVSIDPARTAEVPALAETNPAEPAAETPDAEQPWYVPERTPRRRNNE